MSELIGTVSDYYLPALLAVLVWTMVMVLVRGRRQSRWSRARPAAFWAVFFVVATIVLVLTVRLAHLA
jgi:hypothetical protein